jgi:hypothetical protein
MNFGGKPSDVRQQRSRPPNFKQCRSTLALTGGPNGHTDGRLNTHPAVAEVVGDLVIGRGRPAAVAGPRFAFTVGSD